jgi:hypothetical protein
MGVAVVISIVADPTGIPAHDITYLKDSAGWDKDESEGEVAARELATAGGKPMLRLNK